MTSSETMETFREWNDIFKGQKEKQANKTAVNTEIHIQKNSLQK